MSRESLTMCIRLRRWVREFLNDENHGLDSLIEYLSFRLVMMRHEQASESRNSSEENFGQSSNGELSCF